MDAKRWSNWAGNHRERCEVVEPRGRDELCEIIGRRAREDRRIRAAGTGHSWSPLVTGADTIVRMDHLDRQVEPECAGQRITVESGMTIRALDRLAARWGMTLESPTLFPMLTVGGAISTGSHGTDFRSGGFADQVVELQIVDATGTLRRVGRGDRALPAAQVALGCLGVVYAVTLELVPQFQVEVLIRTVPVRRVLAEFADLRRSCDFLELFWFPFQDEMWVYLMTRTATPPDPVTLRSWLRSHTLDAVQEVAAEKMIPWIARHAPRLTPALNVIASRLAFEEGLSVKTASDAFHFQNVYTKCWCEEYAVPATHAAEAWGSAVALVEHYAESSLYPMNLTLHGRFSDASPCWLSPAHGRDTFHLEIASVLGTPHWKPFFRQLEREWCGIPGARPHWGKLFWQTERIRKQYPEMKTFLDVRQLWDPKRVFLNSFLERDVFGI